MMWVLLLMLMFDGHPVHQPLNTFPTQATCEAVRVLVEAEMHRVYPEDLALRVACMRQSI